MGENSGIEWTQHTFNPWIGCSKVSPGCDHCYAENWAKRSGLVQWGGERRRTSVSNWKQPLKWNQAAIAAGVRRKVFCASLADVFDNQIDPEWRRDLFSLIAKTKQLDWQLLTKRIGNAAEMLDDISVTTPSLDPQWWPNVWLGITVVNQEEADRDIPKLLEVPAAVRFLSCEPLLGPIELYDLNATGGAPRGCAVVKSGGMTVGTPSEPPEGYDDSYVGVDWVIVGGESGSKAREMNPHWARFLLQQCRWAGVAFFLKQMTKKAPIPDDLLVREFPMTPIQAAQILCDNSPRCDEHCTHTSTEKQP